MGEFKTECTICKGSFESEQEYNDHKCQQTDSYEHMQFKQEIFIEEDEATSSNAAKKTSASFGGHKGQAHQKGKIEDMDPLSLVDDPLNSLEEEEKPPGIDHETIRSLVLNVKDRQEMDPSKLVNYDRQYSCRLCHMLFTNSEEFTNHFKYDHKNYRPFECSVCGKKFLQKHYVNLHMRIHTGEKPYKCSLCPRAYSHKTSLVIHMRIHNGDRPFRCGVCGKRCYDKSGLTSHMRSHTKETPYSCKVCDRKFTHSKSLLVHHRNHTGEKPYTCEYCGKAFRHWHKHKIHVRLHTGERPYKCSVCGKGFPRNDEVNRHMKSHTGIKTFKCSICGVYCATQASITGHINLHHSNLKGEEQPEKTLVRDSSSGILGKESISFPTIKSTLRNTLVQEANTEKTATQVAESKKCDATNTRVIEITSKDTPLPPPSIKSKHKKTRHIACNMPLPKTSNFDKDKPMNYQEFIDWQERMLTKQGLVVKRFPCDNDEASKGSKRPVEAIQDSSKPSPTDLPSVSGEMLRKALMGNTETPKDTSDKQSKTQYILLSQPGNANSKILVPVNVTNTNTGGKVGKIIAPLQATNPPATPISGSPTQKTEQSRPLILVPQSMSSQSFILVQNGPQKMLLLAPQTAPPATTTQSATAIQAQTSNEDATVAKISLPSLKIKMDPDPLPLENSSTSSILASAIKQEIPDESFEALIKQEPEDD